MGLVAVLKADPDLGDGIPGRQRQLAVRASITRSFTVSRGRWDGRRKGTAGRGVEDAGYGFLVLSGALCRRVEQAERCAAELIGPGDLIRPWDVVTEWSTLPVEATWSALLPTEIAVLDDGFSRRTAAFPAIAEGLVRRALMRSRYLAILSSIASQRRLETRLHMLFWHLADRFGRMTGEWIEIPLPLTHGLLSELVAARRPSVSTCISRLHSRSLLVQEAGRWRLSGTVPPEYQALRQIEHPPVAPAA